MDTRGIISLYSFPSKSIQLLSVKLSLINFMNCMKTTKNLTKKRKGNAFHQKINYKPLKMHYCITGKQLPFEKQTRKINNNQACHYLWPFQW